LYFFTARRSRAEIPPLRGCAQDAKVAKRKICGIGSRLRASLCELRPHEPSKNRLGASLCKLCPTSRRAAIPQMVAAFFGPANYSQSDG